MAGDGGGQCERDKAMKLVRKRRNHKINQHLTGWNLTWTQIEV